MRIGVVDQPHINMLEGTVVSHTVLLKSLGVKDHDLQAPHHQSCSQHYLVTPELPFQQLVEVLLVAEGTTMGCSWICDAVGSSQNGVHVDKHLPVLHHPVHHLVTKVSVGVVRQIPVTIFGAHIPTVAYLEALLDGRKRAIAIAFNLEKKSKSDSQNKICNGIEKSLGRKPFNQATRRKYCKRPELTQKRQVA